MAFPIDVDLGTNPLSSIVFNNWTEVETWIDAYLTAWDWIETGSANYPIQDAYVLAKETLNDFIDLNENDAINGGITGFCDGRLLATTKTPENFKAFLEELFCSSATTGGCLLVHQDSTVGAHVITVESTDTSPYKRIPMSLASVACGLSKGRVDYSDYINIRNLIDVKGL